MENQEYVNLEDVVFEISCFCEEVEEDGFDFIGLDRDFAHIEFAIDNLDGLDRDFSNIEFAIDNLDKNSD